MGFFNSLSIRIPLAIIGGILYGALTYTIAIFLDLPSEFAFSAAIIVFLFYLGSRFYKRDLDKVERVALAPEN